MNLWHADSLAGPMRKMREAFAAGQAGVGVELRPGRSRELAEAILRGERCDVFVSSDPAVVQGLFGKAVPGGEAASWYVVFSANELVVMTAKGNPLGLRTMTDLARSGIRVVRVAGGKDLATGRTLTFIARATAAEGQPGLAEAIIAAAAPQNTIPDVLAAVREGRADAGIVYRSAAMTATDTTELIPFPPAVNLSDEIRNAVTIPGTAGESDAAEAFVRLLLSSQGRAILAQAGQPPLVPPLKVGRLPFALPGE